MRHIIICRGLAVAVLLMVASVARAEIAGIRDESECPTTVDLKTIKDKLNGTYMLSPINDAAHFQAQKSRFLFCIDQGLGFDKKDIIAPTNFVNASQYPVIIYGLKIISNTAQVGKPLLTTTGPILLQNLTAENLRGPIVMGGAASMMASTLSCDTTPAGFYSDKVLMITGTGQRFTKVSISNCNEAIEVIGTGSVLKDLTVTFDKALSPYDMEGGEGVILGAGSVLTATALGDTTISGYASALEMMSSSRATYVKVIGSVSMKESAKLGLSDVSGTVFVTGNAVLISKNTLGGDPAVAISKGLTGVKVTQNTYLFKIDTKFPIAFVDPDDLINRTMFDVTWIASELSKIDSIEYVTRLFGKLMDQNSLATNVEVYLHDTAREDNKYPYSLSCPVGTASDEMCFSDSNDANNKCIHKGEKVFDCSEESLKKVFQMPPKSFVRLLSNVPTVSVMSEQLDISSIPRITIVAIALPSMPVGSELSIEMPAESTGDGGFDAPQFDPANPTDLDGNSNSNNATSGVVTVGGGPGGFAGASAAGVPAVGCSLPPIGASQDQAAKALLWVLVLLPLPLLIPFRQSKDDK